MKIKRKQIKYSYQIAGTNITGPKSFLRDMLQPGDKYRRVLVLPDIFGTREAGLLLQALVAWKNS